LSVFEVPTWALVKVIAADFKKQGITQPVWASFVKTGSHKERVPDSPDWFWERMASILYRVFKEGCVGTGSLRSYYGGKKRQGPKRPHFRKAGGKIIRLCLQNLEKQGLVKKSKKGRVITAKGQSYLNQKAKEAIAFAKEFEAQKLMAVKHEKKTEAEKKVEEDLRKREQVEKDKVKAKEEAKKKEKHKEEKKPEEQA
jgi:small subunit ribosomal protein S19e